MNNKNKRKKKKRVEATIRVTTEKTISDDKTQVEEEKTSLKIDSVDFGKQKKKPKEEPVEERTIEMSIPDESQEDTERTIEFESFSEVENEDSDSDSNVTDIATAMAKEKHKKLFKRVGAVCVVLLLAAGVYLSRGRWVPKLEGILDKSHETIVNDGKIQAGNFPISFHESSVNILANLNEYLVRVDENKVILYDENGEQANSFNHSFASPVVKVASKRMLIYDNGGNEFQVLNRKDIMLEKTVDSKILLGAIAVNSYVAVVTEDDNYSSVLTVYDSSGNVIYRWSSNSRVLSVDFNSDGTGCFVSTFNADKGELKSVVRYLSFDKTEEVMKSVRLDGLIVDVMENDNGDFWAVGDTCFYKLDKTGAVELQYDYPGEMVDYELGEKCAGVTFKGVQRQTGVLVLFNSETDLTQPDSVIYTDMGSPKKLDIDGTNIFLLKENTLDAYDRTGSFVATADVSSDYIDFNYFGGNVYFLGYREINKITFNT